MFVDDQKWAAVITIGTIIALRVLDWFMPKGHHSIWAAKHGVPAEDEPDAE